MNVPTLPVRAAFSGTPLADAAEWDAYVAAHADATPFHSRAWCEAITRATGHRCHLVTARGEQHLVFARRHAGAPERNARR